MLRSIAVALFLLPQLAAAATFTATRADDPLPDTCLPADCSLREAVLAAEATPEPDVIALPAGTFQLVSRAGGPYPSGHSGPLILDTPMTIVGAGRAATTLTATPDLPLLMAIGLGSPATSVVLSDLAIANVVPNNPAFGVVTVGDLSSLALERVEMRGNGSGAPAIYAGGPLTIRDSAFLQNTGAGAAVVYALRPPVAITQSSFAGNISQVGALAIGDPDTPLGEVTLTGNVFRDNLASSGGGAVTVLASAGVNRIDLSDSVFEQNHAGEDGGAVRILYASDAPNTTRLTVVADGTRFTGNEADGGCGAILLEAETDTPLLEAPVLAMDLARFDDNIAASHGGALCTAADTTITRATFDGNRSDGQAGAIFAAGPTLLVQRSTISHNSAATVAGGIVALTTLTLEHSTVHGNTAGSSVAGLLVFGPQQSTIRRSTISGNLLNGVASSVRVGIAPQLDGGVRFVRSIVHGACSSNSPDGFATNSSFSIESPGNTCALATGVGSFNQRSVPLASLALGMLDDNGGPTLTRMPGPTSVAIDVGLPGNVPCGEPDQRGYLGTDPRCDAGAVEVAALPPTPPAPDIFLDGFE